MTITEKREIAEKIKELLSRLISDDEPQEIKRESKPLEMLTIRECTEAVKGISEHTIRQLVAQNKVPFIRTGEGKRGKILISKSALLDLLTKSA